MHKQYDGRRELIWQRFSSLKQLLISASGSDFVYLSEFEVTTKFFSMKTNEERDELELTIFSPNISTFVMYLPCTLSQRTLELELNRIEAIVNSIVKNELAISSYEYTLLGYKLTKQMFVTYKLGKFYSLSNGIESNKKNLTLVKRYNFSG